MSLTFNYTQLKAELQNYPEDDNQEFIDNIDTIIGLGELKCLRDLDLEIFDETNVDLNTTVGVRTLTKPTGHLKVKSLFLTVSSTNVQLLPRTNEYCEIYAPDSTVQPTPMSSA